MPDTGDYTAEQYPGVAPQLDALAPDTQLVTMTRCGRGHGRHLCVDMSAVPEGHDACAPIGVRWLEPVLQGTNAVIVHPNALGQRGMAAQAMKVRRLR